MGAAGCVLQVPDGWVLVTMTNNRYWAVTVDDPALLAIYTPEPGHQLIGFSGTGYFRLAGSYTIPQITLNVTLAIPADALGTYTLKASLAGGGWTIQSPAGVAQFAAITAAPHARQIAVLPAPASDFVFDQDGPAPGATTERSSIAVGDIDRDGREDLAVCEAATGIHCWLSRPNGWVERSAGIAPLAMAVGVALGDLDGDGFPDLVDGRGNAYFGNGGVSWTPGAPLPLALPAALYRNVAIADIDSDGRADIAISGGTRGVVQVLHNLGNRTFVDASPGLPLPAGGDQAMASRNLQLIDLDGDGDLDILSPFTNQSSIWRNDGPGGWIALTGLPTLTNCAVAGDLDGNGIPEILVGTGPVGYGGRLSVYTIAQGAVVQVANAGLPTVGRSLFFALALFDFDRDGLLDVVCGNASTNIELFRNVGTGFVAAPSPGLPTALNGEVVAIAAGDLDGNAFSDLAIVTSAGVGGLWSTNTWQNRATGIATLGGGCGGTALAEPTLTALGTPTLGDSAFALQVHSPGQGLVGLLWIGDHAAPMPLDLTPLGAPTCALHVSLDQLFLGPLDASGNFTTALPVPNTPELAFQTAFVQGGVHGAGTNAVGVVFTRGIAVRLR